MLTKRTGRDASAHAEVVLVVLLLDVHVAGVASRASLENATTTNNNNIRKQNASSLDSMSPTTDRVEWRRSVEQAVVTPPDGLIGARRERTRDSILGVRDRQAT